MEAKITPELLRFIPPTWPWIYMDKHLSPETVPLQETAQRDVVPAIEIHVDHPRVHAIMGRIVGLWREAREEHSHPLVVVRVQRVGSPVKDGVLRLDAVRAKVHFCECARDRWAVGLEPFAEDEPRGRADEAAASPEVGQEALDFFVLLDPRRYLPRAYNRWTGQFYNGIWKRKRAIILVHLLCDTSKTHFSFQTRFLHLVSVEHAENCFVVTNYRHECVSKKVRVVTELYYKWIEGFATWGKKNNVLEATSCVLPLASKTNFTELPGKPLRPQTFICLPCCAIFGFTWD